MENKGWLRRFAEQVRNRERPGVVGQPGGFHHEFGNGFHIYAELRLKLELSASEDTANAARYYRLIQLLVAAAEEAGKRVGAELLEVQPPRVHLFMEADEATGPTVRRVVAFCAALTEAAYDLLKKEAGDAWLGFSMTTDFGPTVLIHAGLGASASLVSLAPAANAPAKLLGSESSPAANLTLRTKYRNLLAPAEISGEWCQIPLLELPEYVALGDEDERRSVIRRAVLDALRTRQLLAMAPVRIANRAYFDQNGYGPVNFAIKVQGLVLRADLDGFTNQVSDAFSRGPTAVQGIVQRFTALMGFARAFANSLDREVILLPWAGDCANMVLLPKRGESYEQMRTYAAPITAAAWHDQGAVLFDGRAAWRSLMGAAEWVVAIAGGDAKEGATGYLLVAPVAASTRSFLVAAGWGSGRSFDAHNANGLRSGDSVVPAVDWRVLETLYQRLFAELDSRFCRAEKLTMEKVRRGVKSLSATPAVVPGSNITVPQPRPYFGK